MHKIHPDFKAQGPTGTVQNSGSLNGDVECDSRRWRWGAPLALLRLYRGSIRPRGKTNPGHNFCFFASLKKSKNPCLNFFQWATSRSYRPFVKVKWLNTNFWMRGVFAYRKGRGREIICCLQLKTKLAFFVISCLEHFDFLTLRHLQS